MFSKEQIIRIRSRKEYIDVLRALAMFFVILGHQVRGDTKYFVFTSPIKIPLFFFITGYVFNYSQKSTIEFFRKLLLNVMVPWLCLTIPFILIKLVFQRTSLFNELYDLFSGNSFWYIPCCIVAEIVWFFINKYCRSVRMVIVISLILSIFGIVFSSHRILEFAKTNIAMIAQYWIMLGYLCRYYEDKFKCVKCSYIILMSLLYIGMGFLSLSLWPESSIDVKNHIYYNYPFNFAMITLGCITVYLLAEWLEKTAKRGGIFQKILVFLGQNTLVFFFLHGYNVLMVVFVLSKANVVLTRPLLVLVKVIFAYILCTIETIIILRFFPWVLGKRAPLK